MACRDEFNLLAVGSLSDGDGFQLPIAVAFTCAGQS
jgi:hypothetical protein